MLSNWCNVLRWPIERKNLFYCYLKQCLQLQRFDLPVVCAELYMGLSEIMNGLQAL